MTRAVALVRGPVSYVWIALVAFTLLSWWVGGDHGIASVRIAGAVVLVVAFVKLRFVGLYFMELRDAPRPLRTAFESWCVGVCALLVVMSLVML
ncbi:cytochrome C oxidase subunit IV family protein [Actinomycetospora sp. TBRC 11914]|uniref:cytochrome C oxidase subunit IV family protein n=1 Tax=Actinomycetospora sp. TBRC 11914 TaxID=2729387 RepID=UPI00145D1314|nr:cytochrome C oxidase subunit IV family protein [Actinomycetospora sp. TBRC 11914]NMO91686.1 cytochrome C oxidase subunit IV family protein [Actinomycetospora sp. TBRC 11914]